MDTSKWKTIGIGVPVDFPIGGKDFTKTIKKYFDWLWEDARPETQQRIAEDPNFKAISDVIG